MKSSSAAWGLRPRQPRLDEDRPDGKGQVGACVNTAILTEANHDQLLRAAIGG